MPPKRLSIAEVRARNASGYIDHNTYTQATHDGTHWDVGPNFPWDVFGNYVTSFFSGGTGGVDEMPEPKDLWTYGIRNPDSGLVMSAADRLLDVETNVGKLIGLAQGGFNADNAIKAAIAAVKADTNVSGQHETDILEALADLSEKVSAITPATGTE
jgi:hypothetical protein